MGILTSNTDENNSHNKTGMKNAGLVIILHLPPKDIVSRSSLWNVERVPAWGLDYMVEEGCQGFLDNVMLSDVPLLSSKNPQSSPSPLQG